LYWPVGQGLGFLAHLHGEELIRLISQLLLHGLVFALPFLIVLFLTEMALAFIAKVLPQANLFMLGMPVKILVGLWLILASLPGVQENLKQGTHWILHQTYRLMPQIHSHL
jgi:flagellar biosynthetic protein FliR